VLALLVHFGLRFAIPNLADVLGFQRSFRDAGDLWEQAGAIAAYSDERLSAVAGGITPAAPPQVRGDSNTARVAYVAAVVDMVAIALIAALASGWAPRYLARAWGLDRSPIRDVYRPVIAVAVTVAALAGYVALVRLLDFEGLAPSGAAPATVLRDTPALLLFGLVTIVLAPVAEELLFRGLLFGGLLQLGFIPAMAISSVAFAAWHLSPQAIPLIAVGCVLAWLYYVSASLWHAITFHAIFNLVAFVQFAGTR
jgi:membrane protease YdiL (CAAX protease family)